MNRFYNILLPFIPVLRIFSFVELKVDAHKEAPFKMTNFQMQDLTEKFTFFQNAKILNLFQKFNNLETPLFIYVCMYLMACFRFILNQSYCSYESQTFPHKMPSGEKGRKWRKLLSTMSWRRRKWRNIVRNIVRYTFSCFVLFRSKLLPLWVVQNNAVRW